MSPQATPQPRRTAAEVIATYLSSDINDVKEMRYQPTRYPAPAIYTSGEYYYCSPKAKQAKPKGWKWELVGEHYGRSVFRAHMNPDNE